MAILPIAILWFGTGTPAALSIVAYAAFFPIVVNTIHGVSASTASWCGRGDDGRRRAADILRTSSSRPRCRRIGSGPRIAMGVAWTAIIAAELAVGAKSGGGGPRAASAR